MPEPTQSVVVTNGGPSDSRPRLSIAIVALTLRLDNVGGLQQRVRTLAMGLAERGHRVRIVQGGWAAQGSHGFFDQAGHLPIERVAVQPDGGPTRPDRYLRLLVGPKPDETLAGVDVIDSWDPILWPKNGHAPLVYSSNAFWPYHLEHLWRCGFRQSAMGLIQTTVQQLAILRADALIVENHGMARLARTLYRVAANEIAVVPPGYVPADVEAATVDPAGNLIVYAGRMARNKGLRELITAFSELAPRHDSRWRLRLVGGGPDCDRLEALAHSLDVGPLVEFTGAVPTNVAVQHLGEATITVMPSYIETYSIVLLEAMALGRPVVATNVGAVRMGLVRDGVTGLVARPGSVSSLRDKLDLAMSDPDLRERLGHAGRRVAAKLTIDRMVDATERAYRSAIAASRA